ATAERRPMCADTGLPRYYVRAGNEAVIEGGFVALERALRRATADATASVPLRPNRVHPLTRRDHDNNVGIHAPEVTYAFEPRADWVDVTTVHKGGLFGTDYRMLFPTDGGAGIERVFLATLVELANTDSGGLPVGMHSFCLASRRGTARIHPDGRVEFRADPMWFTDYYRREGVE